MLTLNRGRNQSRRQYDILEIDSKPDARSESHKIANALNKQSLTKTILGFACGSGYKCHLLLQTLLHKLSTQQHGLPLKRQNTKTLATCDPIKSLLSSSCDSKPQQSNVINKIILKGINKSFTVAPDLFCFS